MQTKEFTVNKEAESFEIGERFQIQTCIFYHDKSQKYESKPVSIAPIENIVNA